MHPFGALTFEALAEDALLLRMGAHIDIAANARVHGAAERLRRCLPTVEVAPAYASVLLRFDPAQWGMHNAHGQVEHAARAALVDAEACVAAPRERVIPVCYGGEHGPDLAAVAAHAGLEVAETIRRHGAGDYRVAMLGFAPGFAYLLGLDRELAMPRRSDPRQRVPAGSVAIGGAQTGIYPGELPGGWHVIGRTPLRLFDVAATPPALLRAGDRVRFVAIDAERFHALAGDPHA